MSWMSISRYAVGRMSLQNSAVHLPHYTFSTLKTLL